MSRAATITLATTIALALFGYVATYINNLRLARRADALGRVNRQLSELYGPLLALESAAGAAWTEFRKRYRPGMSFWRESPPPTEVEAAAYRLWMESVFMPLNRRMIEVILNHADLVDDVNMPKCFLELYAHVVTYEPVIAKWKIGDMSEHLSAIVFPRGSLQEHVRTTYRGLKAKQMELLGTPMIEECGKRKAANLTNTTIGSEK